VPIIEQLVKLGQKMNSSVICIVVEEVDESEYWLEVIKEANLSKEAIELDRLLLEAGEINKIMTKAKHSAYVKK
jgi:four helix bundle protein